MGPTHTIEGFLKINREGDSASAGSWGVSLLSQVRGLALRLQDVADMHKVRQHPVERICYASVLHIRELGTSGEKFICSGLYFLLKNAC